MKAIKSKYIFQNIFDYIKDFNYKYKLFRYSKFYQNYFELKLEEFKEIYIIQLGLDIEKYNLLNVNPITFDKEDFIKTLEKYNLTLNDIQTFIINHLKRSINYHKEKRNDFKYSQYNYYNIPINIYSPFLETISTSDYFEEIFTIQIPTKEIDDHDLKKDYISTFKKLKNNNSNFSSLLIKINYDKDMSYFHEFNIDYGKIKFLIIKKDGYSTFNNCYSFYDSILFNFNNLIYLNLESLNNKIKEKENQYLLIKHINNLKQLEILILTKFYFANFDSVLDLDNLKVLNLSFCKQIKLSKNLCLKLKKLCLIMSSISNEEFLEFPELEDFRLNSTAINDDFKKNINFKSLKKIKRIIVYSNYFVLLENTLLEYAKLNANKNNSHGFEKFMFEKILSIETLKVIDITLNYLNHNDFGKILGLNNSVIKANILWINQKEKNYNILNLLNIFPNLQSINISIINGGSTKTQ